MSSIRFRNAVGRSRASRGRAGGWQARPRASIGRAAGSTSILLISLVYLLPFAILALLALSSSGLELPKLLNAANWRLSNFSEAFVGSHMGRAMVNSLVITASSLALLVFCASMAGWAISRFPTRIHRAFMALLIACMMIPGIINTVPLYTLLNGAHLTNTLIGMILVCATNALPFSTFLYSGFVRTIPKEMEEAAIIDGCSWFGAYWRITFRYLQPVTAAVIILNGISIWNNYAQAVFLLQTENVHTIPQSISLFFQQYGARWQLVAAASFIGVVPALALFLGFQRFFIKGITAGAVKG